MTLSVFPPHIFIFIYLSRLLTSLCLSDDIQTKDSTVTVFIVRKKFLIWSSAYIFYIFLQMYIVPFSLKMFTCWKTEYMNIYMNVMILFCSLKYENASQKAKRHKHNLSKTNQLWRHEICFILLFSLFCLFHECLIIISLQNFFFSI